MVQYRELRKHKRRFLALTGLTDKEFKAILPWFQKAHEASQAVAKTQKGKKRKRAVGGGRKAKLETIEDRLLFVLMYQKATRSKSC